MIRSIFGFWLITLTVPLYGQFESRANFYLGVSLPVFQQESGMRSSEIFNGYASMPFVSAAGMYAVNKRIQLGIDLHQMYTLKPNYRMNNTSIGAVMKYNFTPFNRKVSPFLYGAVHASYLFVSQKQNSETRLGGTADGEYVEVEQYYVENPAINLSVFPVLGVHGGGGIEINPRSRKKNLGAFVTANYFYSRAESNQRVKELYSMNQSALAYVFASAGIRVSLLRRKSIY